LRSAQSISEYLAKFIRIVRLAATITEARFLILAALAIVQCLFAAQADEAGPVAL
jgi:hypothetical protein